ncbi:heterokaryon incompatibility protein-domain-containing protein [Xylaria bambusicola]|uniref:heterokaryon incompatibility protein-domain-containing protein n=1 Tax=Xylaria bambusicola TaxID=326684 RepID=UPI00200777C6|nr:heterokaryon incompatibility protein-domain-containing protein [Xylaria bambusicola]KAI0503229.1 heterokaryon incompatibility protein-domain-containing protein [Xylaria bambusicola]
MGGVLTLPRCEPGQSDFCTLCCAVDATLRAHASRVHSGREPKGAEDVYLGKKSDLLARSSTCQSCLALVSCAEEDCASFSESQAPMCAGDYDFSAHLMDSNPVLCIAFGSLPFESTDASQRRQLMSQLGVLSLFSTDQDVPEDSDAWLAGRPRLFDPKQCDPCLIRGWLDHCNHFHGNRCLVPQAWRCKADVIHNFIDVELECIASPTTEVPFAALSYVWGVVDTLQCLESNIDSLRQPGSLSSSGSQVVPQTIRDAMRLCALTGYRYLWVDRVCIMQDNDEIKQQHLQGMGWIYAAADFTIVAAEGSDVNHGFSGLGHGVKERQKHIIPFPSKPLIRGTIWSLGDSLPSNTVWSSRAWTFQEHVFSRRLLYVNKFVNWVCASARWTEAVSLPPGISQSLIRAKDDHHSDAGKVFALDWPSLKHYASMVEQYNVRKLTYDSDVAIAFGGLLLQMCMGFSAGFYGGIPEFYFTICLLWQPKRGLRPRFNQPDTRFLPTWSWLGWSGALDLQMWTCNTDMELPPAPYEVTISPVTEWFKSQDRRDGSHIGYTYFQVRKLFHEGGAPTPPEWRKHDGGPESGYHAYYTYRGQNLNHIGSIRKFRYPIPPFQRYRNVSPLDLSARYLYATVQKAFFVFGTPEDIPSQRYGDCKDGSYEIVDLPVYTTSSEWAGSIRANLHQNDALPIGQKCEVIRIAMGSSPLKNGDLAGLYSEGVYPVCPFGYFVGREELRGMTTFDFYFVLWIRWDGDTACRQALGVIWKHIWERAAPEDVDIKLG